MSIAETFAIVSAAIVVGWICWSLRRTGDGSQARTGSLCLFAALWLSIPSLIGISGFLSDFHAMPPRMPLVLVVILIVATVFAFSSSGTALVRRFSLSALIGFHSFRILPEILLLLAYREGLAPIQMTLEGRNWDLLSAVTALAIALVWRRTAPPKGIVVAWSVLSIGLLLNILTLAVLSMPTPIRAFHNDPANTFVATFPFILLPAVHVAAAIGGHILVFRKLYR